MKKVLCITILWLLFVGIMGAAPTPTPVLAVNNSTIYKVEKDALYTTSLNFLTIIVKYCVTSTTQIYLNNRPVPLSALKPRMRVAVYYYTSSSCGTAIIRAYSY